MLFFNLECYVAYLRFFYNKNINVFLFLIEGVLVWLKYYTLDSIFLVSKEKFSIDHSLDSRSKHLLLVAFRNIAATFVF